MQERKAANADKKVVESAAKEEKKSLEAAVQEAAVKEKTLRELLERRDAEVLALKRSLEER
jgi:hypothetical protein